MRLYLEKTLHKKRAGGVAQGDGPEFKSQYCKKRKEKKLMQSRTTPVKNSRAKYCNVLPCFSECAPQNTSSGEFNIDVQGNTFIFKYICGILDLSRFSGLLRICSRLS
jgi:hypothetical protein